MPDEAYRPQAAGRFAPGSRISGYRLEALIGRGGMAEVWRARDERLDRLVALKIIAPELAGNLESRRRFIREARAAAAVHDPHIIPVLEAGDDSGALFIAMPLVEGSDAGTLVRQRGELPPGQVAEIVSQVAAALDAAHAKGLVHRDVKPANMLLAARRPGRPDHVYLSDFGLTRAARDSGLTGSGQFLGTADYVAPEQIRHRDVDGRADQYALGCSAFELLCGEPPFRRDHGQATLQAHQSEPPPLLTSLRAGLPAEVNDVFAKVLAKSPAERYPACQDFADSLRSVLGLQPYAGVAGTGAPEEQAISAELPPTKQGKPTGILATGCESAAGKTTEHAEKEPGMGNPDGAPPNHRPSIADKTLPFIGLLTAAMGLISSLTRISDYWKLGIAIITLGIGATALFTTWDAWKMALRRYSWLGPLGVGIAVGLAFGLPLGIFVLSGGHIPPSGPPPTPTHSPAPTPTPTHSPTPTVTITPPGPSGSVLGDINFAGYCKSLGYSQIELQVDDVTGWKCGSGTGIVGMPVANVCHWQYGNQATGANFTNYNDPFSWYCYSGSLVTPQPLGSDLGDINFAAYCKSLGYSQIELQVDDVTGWKCGFGTGIVGMPVANVCHWQYGNQATGANWTNYNDPFSWYCQ